MRCSPSPRKTESACSGSARGPAASRASTRARTASPRTRRRTRTSPTTTSFAIHVDREPRVGRLVARGAAAESTGPPSRSPDSPSAGTGRASRRSAHRGASRRTPRPRHAAIGAPRVRSRNAPDDRLRERRQEPDSISSNEVRAIRETEPGVLWVGTAEGLDRVELATKDVTHFTRADGINATAISGIVADAEGNLWLSGDQGVTRFNPTLKKGQQFTKCRRAAGARLQSARVLQHAPGRAAVRRQRRVQRHPAESARAEHARAARRAHRLPADEQAGRDRREGLAARDGDRGDEDAHAEQQALRLHLRVRRARLHVAGEEPVRLQARRLRSRVARRRHAAHGRLHQPRARQVHLPREGVEQRRCVERGRRIVDVVNHAALLCVMVVPAVAARRDRRGDSTTSCAPERAPVAPRARQRAPRRSGREGSQGAAVPRRQRARMLLP